MTVKEYVKKFAEKRKNVFRSDIGFFILKWVPCHRGTTRPQVVSAREDRQISRAAGNIPNVMSQLSRQL
jgi:hypothetical protein